MRTDSTEHRRTSVLIVGAGPVGLFLGLALQRHGIPCLLVDRRGAVSARSRAIGIHPPSLELFDQVGLAGALLAEGHRIHQGVARTRTRVLGTMNFNEADGAYPFIITLPQGRTEQLMQDALMTTKAQLCLGTITETMEQHEGGITATVRNEAGTHTTISAAYLVGCDGRDSAVRDQWRIPFRGGDYPDRYAMGDFPDHMPKSDVAYIYMDREGLVEAIPLPNGIRRWVLRLPTGVHEITGDAFPQTVLRRTGERLPAVPDPSIDIFGIQHYLADRVVEGRVLLAGDAAHVMSPIGGQGMNIGWMDAWELACKLSQVGSDEAPAFPDYDQTVRRRARIAIRRAHANTMLGRQTLFPAVRNGLIRVMLNSPLRSIWLRRFTMRGLPQLQESPSPFDRV